MQTEEKGIFTKQKINFNPPDVITHLVASNNLLVLALANGTILRIPLQHPEKQNELVVTKNPGEKISYLHLDPTGQHLIISTSIGENFFLHEHSNALKPLAKFKGNIVSAVGWNQELCKDSTTSYILIGTSRGLLFETELQNGNVQYFKQLYCVSDNPSMPKPVTGIELHRCKTQQSRWFVFLTTPGQLYPFVGTVSFNSGNWVESAALQTMFLSYQQNPGRIHTLDPSATMSSPSGLKMYPVIGDEPPHSFAWLAAPGISYGQIDSDEPDAFKMITAEKLYSHPEVNGRPDWPVSLAVSEFHLILLYKDRLIAVSLLNEDITYEDLLGQKYGKVGGVTRDPVSGLIWVHTDRSVLKYRATDEARYVWSVYLERGDFMQARKFAAGNPKNLDVVLRRQAQKLISEKKYVAAAEILAMTDAPFEETALKFVQVEDRNGLRTFLEKKLDQLEPMEKTQQTMLVLWLLELHLTELGEAKSGTSGRPGRVGGRESFISGQEVSESQAEKTGFDPHKYRQLRDQFRFFMGRTNVLEVVKSNPDAVYQVMTSHGDVDALLYFADLMRDYEEVANLYVQQEHYEEALNVLRKQGDPRLFYKFSTILMANIPGKVVDAWIGQKGGLQPKLLLPAMFLCDVDAGKAEEVLRYLEFCLNSLGTEDQAVHNYLISVYAKYKPSKLQTYLEEQGINASTVHYDLKYALRLCSEKGLQEACVHIFCTLGLFEEATNLALKMDVELAKKCAKLPALLEEEDPFMIPGGSETAELRKKLWLCIARHVVEKEKDIAKCVELLQESEGLIKIQDLLPFFPEFATIDHFKDSLCACLKEHSGKIQELQREMKEATEVAQDIRKDMAKLKHRYSVIRVQDKCKGCWDPLMTRPFYAFPCSHHFHTDCLEREVGPFLPAEKLAKFTSLKHQLLAVITAASTGAGTTGGFASAGRGLLYSGEGESSSLHSGSGQNKAEKQLRAGIDEILAEECPWCGEILVNSVDRPFFSPSEYAKEKRSWDV